MNGVQREAIRRAISERARELVDGHPGNDLDLSLSRIFPDYEPLQLPEPEPGAWMPRCHVPPIWNAMHPRPPGGR